MQWARCVDVYVENVPSKMSCVVVVGSQSTQNQGKNRGVGFVAACVRNKTKGKKML